MCEQDSPALGPDPDPPKQHPREHDSTPFPWHLPICDAHCHPVENMTTAQAISSMRAAAIAVMGTRSQDQDLVAELAAEYPVADRAALADTGRDRTGVVPAFGWHPWFSFELYDDEADNPTYKPSADGHGQQAKRAHYAAVLSPDPGDDADFLASLPEPTPLSRYIAATRDRLAAHPHALMGEMGLDKAFRLPGAWLAGAQAARDPTRTPGGRERRRLSPYHVRMPHQQAVLAAQLRLAGSMHRPVSVHGVQAHGILYDTLAATWKGHEKEVVSRRKRRLAAPHAEDAEDTPEHTPGPKPYPPRICLHSFSGRVEVARQYFNRTIPADIYFSFSTVVNLSTESGRTKMRELVREVPDDRILVESDLHHAGKRMDNMLEDMYREVCEIKGWGLEEGVNRIAKNYQDFIFG